MLKMSCIFCDSVSHLSQFCDIYASNKSRRNNLRSKKICNFCLKDFKNNHSDALCKLNLKCFICFCKEHNALFCPEKFYDAQLFIPYIDEILLPRFLQCFNCLEQYSLAFSSPLVLKAFSPRPLQILDRIEAASNKFVDYSIANILVTDQVTFEHVDSEEKSSRTFADLIASRTVIIKVKSIILRGCNLFPSEFFFLLSKRTKFFDCNTLKIPSTSKITFSEILEAIPNVEIFELENSEIKIEKTWANDLAKYKNLRQLKMTIPNFNFDVQSLAAFMKTKKCVKITLCIDVSTFSSFDRAQKRINTKLSQHFKRCKTLKESDFQKFSILFIEIFEHSSFGETFMERAFISKK